MTAEQKEKLNALGYAPSAAKSAGTSLKREDPKDHIATSNTLHEAMLAVEDGKYQRAIPMLQTVLADSPLISAAHLQLGIALARVRQYPEAIVSLKKAIEFIPESTQAQYEL